MSTHFSEENIHKIMSVASIYAGLTFVSLGVTRMNDSMYIAPDTPAGWAMGMAWIVVGGVIATTWFLYVASSVIAQKLNNAPRWTMTRIVLSSLVLVIAAGCGVIGTWHTWKHPYGLGECICADDQYGPTCMPCQCDHGVCHAGIHGTGICACDFGWAGEKCDRCDDRHKPEPVAAEPACNICKTGFEGENCEFCAVGYTGDECDVCDTGWRPWQNYSKLFPDTISEDNRHICDECLPNHWGYYCSPCPLGNDVPKKMLSDKTNNPLVAGETRITDGNNKAGVLYALQTCSPDTLVETCTDWTDRSPDTNNVHALTHVRVQLRYDEDNTVSNWMLLKDIKGIQCNNRGVCRDDVWHQEQFPDWHKTCTISHVQQCTVHSDCKTSQNCRGSCEAVEMPIHPLWAKWNGPERRMCATDSDCLGDPISVDSSGKKQYYTGGRCSNRFCCDESYHGDGGCNCNPTFFGPPLKNTKPHHELSPACDYCPGYDWISQETSTICSGGLGTCGASFASARDDGVLGEYLNMKCMCKRQPFVDPITQIVDLQFIVQWGGELCECGNPDESGQCSLCAPGHWGRDCKMCPAGGGDRACSGHGECDDGPLGSGTCSCQILPESSWMLSHYIPRYKGDCDDCGNKDEDDRTCNECAPNYYDDTCKPCKYSTEIAASQLTDIFQPQGSYHFGPTLPDQSSADPQPVCHPQLPWLCSLACGGGGWCDWGRKGTGKCSCWYNMDSEITWNPLDNVCIGDAKYESSKWDGKTFAEAIVLGAREGLFVESCPAFGYCENGGTSRQVGGFTPCTEDSDCAPGRCFPWNPINWRHTRDLRSCEADY